MWIANSFVIGTTIVLFLLWFRYVCSLLLVARTSMDCSETVARANSLAFPDVLRKLKTDATMPQERMDALVTDLQKDFEVVSYLLRHMGQAQVAATSSETWILKMDYRIRNLRYRGVRRVSGNAARQQLNRMAGIICHFADLIGERSARSRA